MTKTITAFIFTIFSSMAFAHGGGVDENGGHLNRSTREYHCHRDGCLLPNQPTQPDEALSIASFNIQFLGNSNRRDDEALAALLVPHDIVVVQELVSPPSPGTFPNGDAFNPDDESAEFFDAMASHGFEFLMSPEDTGTGDTNHRNGSSTEWWVAFYRPETVQPAEDLPHGYLATDRSNHDDYERVPYAFPFRASDGSTDLVLISVHLKPSAGTANASRRAHELASIAGWIDDNDNAGERDFIIVGDMNIENCTELGNALPPGFVSLNDECEATNTNVNGPRPYDHVFVRRADTTLAEVPDMFEVIDLIEAMRVPWSLSNSSAYPGDPYSHNPFRAVYTDHHPVVFQLVPGIDDD